MRTPSCKHLSTVLMLMACFACSSKRVYSEGVGALGLNLEPTDGVRIDTLHYTVTRTGFSQTAAIPVSLLGVSFSTQIPGLPAATDYSLSLTADALIVAQSMSTRCVAQSDFGILAGQDTSVSVRLQCDGVSNKGSENDAGVTNVCPTVVALRALPSAAPVGGDVTLQADVIDLDNGPKRLTHAWMSTAGVVTDVSPSETTFRCTDVGEVTISLTAYDGDPACNSATHVYVACTPTICTDAHGSSLCEMSGSGGAAGATSASRAGGPAAGQSSGGSIPGGAAGSVDPRMGVTGAGQSAGGWAGTTASPGNGAAGSAGSGSVFGTGVITWLISKVGSAGSGAAGKNANEPKSTVAGSAQPSAGAGGQGAQSAATPSASSGTAAPAQPAPSPRPQTPTEPASDAATPSDVPVNHDAGVAQQDAAPTLDASVTTDSGIATAADGGSGVDSDQRNGRRAKREYRDGGAGH